MDTIRIIAYLTETAMTGVLVSPTVDFASTRCLLRDLFVMEAAILPDPANRLVHVRVHGVSRPAANRALAQLFAQLNEARAHYPGIDMGLAYELQACKAGKASEVSD
jgi:hypothetical protein